MTKILLTLTLLSSTFGMQASNAAAPCAADVKRLAADNAPETPKNTLVPPEIREALATPNEEIIIQWLLQDPVAHRNAEIAYRFGTWPLIMVLANNSYGLERVRTILLDLCPNVLAMSRPSDGSENTNALIRSLQIRRYDIPDLVRRLTVIAFTQGTSLESLEQQTHNIVRQHRDSSNPWHKRIYPDVVYNSQFVFEETAQVRQELDEAAACEKALQAILPRELRAINQTYITDLPVPKQP